MHLIFICVDSLRQDHVSFYNPSSPVETPNIDRLARSAVAFDNMYPEALPTIPVRTALMTGQRTLPFRPWQPLRPEDRTLAEILSRHSYRSAFITDVYHYFRPGYNFHQHFTAWRFVRGQEYDTWRSGRITRFDPDLYMKDSFSPQWQALVRAALRNLEPLIEAGDFPCARLVDEASAWLEENLGLGDLFLYFDCFDPHEPWFPPQEFDRYTDPHYQGKRIILPPGGPASAQLTDEEITYTRGLYAGEVAYVDYNIGRLLDKVESLGILEESLIVLVADHGHPLADHGKFLKSGDRLYSELLKVPFLMRFPGEHASRRAGRRTDALAQFHDIMPTILDVLGFGNELEALGGRSLLPMLRGETQALREAVITGYHQAEDRVIRNKEWSYIHRPEGQPDELYNLLSDPGERTNLIDEHPEIARALVSQFGALYALSGAAIKGVQGRYELSGAG